MPEYVKVIQLPNLFEKTFELSEIQVDLESVLKYAVSGIDEEIKFITQTNIEAFSRQIRDTLLLRDILQAEIKKLQKCEEETL